ncbi:MAG TPA: HYExAFE family protein [Pirellulales bacterium]|jgi:hypothetical protein
MNRDNHYEAAFEEYLRARQVPYVAVDEGRRSLMADTSLKSLDFIVSSSSGNSWLVDVKGRRFPSGEQKQYWKNWSTRDDLTSLSRWETLFGDRFAALFVFAYNIHGDRSPLPREKLFEHQGALYGFLAIRLEYYAVYARQISPRWDTVAMSVEQFRRFAQPIDDLL